MCERSFLTINVRAIVTESVRSPTVRELIYLGMIVGLWSRPSLTVRLMRRLSFRLRQRLGRKCWVVPQSLHRGGAEKDRWRVGGELFLTCGVHRASAQ